VLTTLAAAGVVTIAVTAGMCSGALTIGVERQWTWDLKPTGRLWALGVTAVPFVLFLATVVVLGHKLATQRDKPKRGEDALVLFVLAVEGFALQLGVGQLSKAGLRDWPFIVAVPWTNGYFDAAVHVDDAGEFLRDYHERMAGLNFHCRTHPPGPVLPFLAAIRVFESCPRLTRALSRMLEDSAFDSSELIKALAGAQAVEPVHAEGIVALTLRPGVTLTEAQVIAAWASSMGMVIVCVLGCVPVFFAARRLGGRVCGFWAAAIYLASPCVLYFTPALDQCLSAVAALGGCLWIFAVCRLHDAQSRGPGLWLAAASGFVMAIALFLSISAAVLGVVLGVWCVVKLWGKWRSLAALTAAGAAGVVVFYATLWLFTGHNCIATFRNILAVADENTRQGYIDRAVQFTYWKWLFWNLAEFAIGLGLATTVCLLVRGRRCGQPTALLAALAVVLLLLDVSGTSMSETGRLWMVLMWPAMVAVAGWVSRAGERSALAGAGLIVLLLCQSVALKLFFGWI